MNRFLPILATVVSAGSFWIAHAAITDLPGRVNVNGRMLRMRIEGQGAPSVVLEIGLGGPLEEWDIVQEEVAKFAKVVAYDRIGAVDTKEKLTGTDVVRELRAALQKAGINPPFVLVGQSMGGIYNRLFASLYPDEVVGLVLLDPTQEEFLDWSKIQYPKKRLVSQQLAKQWAEGAGILDTIDEIKAAAPPPNIPIILVTGTEFIDDEDRIKNLPYWTKFHDEWVKKQPQGRHVLEPESGHGVQVEVPYLVVDLIREVVTKARSKP